MGYAGAAAGAGAAVGAVGALVGFAEFVPIDQDDDEKPAGRPGDSKAEREIRDALAEMDE